jgi:metal-responsive CopG/Arc/MetJ family transcriptional regulator
MSGLSMRTTQITLDDELVERIDEIVVELNTTRSAFIRKVLLRVVKNYQVRQLEQKHQEGYVAKPVENNEFRIWETEQEWGSE